MSVGDQAYTVPLDGSRVLMQPPFTPAGVVINNRTDRIVTVQDGRAWSRSVRPGAVGRFAIDRPDSNYVGQLAAAGTTGECRVTFTQTPIVETGEPAAEGPRVILASQVTLSAFGQSLQMLGAGGSHCDILMIAGPGTGSARIVCSYQQTDFVVASLSLPNNIPIPVIVGQGSDIPMPEVVEIVWQAGIFIVVAILYS